MADGATEGTLILQHRMDCAARIGLIAAEWAHLEDQLAHMFEISTADIQQVPGSPIRIVTHPTARAAMAALDSLASRLSVIRNAFTRVIPTMVEPLDVLAQSVRKCATARNEVVHAQWAILDRYPDDAIRVKDRSTYIRYTPKHLEEIITRIIDQTSDIRRFSMRCQEERMRLAREPPPEQEA